MRNLIWLAFLCSSSLFAASSSESTTVNYRTKSGMDAGALRTNGGNLGWTVGLHGAQYLGKSNGYYGAVWRGGSSRGAAFGSDYYYFAGLSFGYDTVIKKYLALDMNVAFGYTDGKLVTDIDTQQGSGFAVNPTVSIGGSVGDGWRIYGSGGYLLNTGNSIFSGTTVGLRVERKIAVQVKGAED